MQTIRKFKEEEIQDLMEIWEQASALAHPFLRSEFVAAVRKAMREQYLPSSESLVYEESGRILGFISMLENEIAGLFVHPDFHSRGIASRLLDKAAEQYECVEVEVFKENRIGRAFYDKQGFCYLHEYHHEASDSRVLRLEKRK